MLPRVHNPLDVTILQRNLFYGAEFNTDLTVKLPTYARLAACQELLIGVISTKANLTKWE